MGKNILDKIKIVPLKIIKVKSGNVMHILKKKELKNWNFAEAYFSKIKFNKFKAWKQHKKMTLNLSVPYGKVKFVFYSHEVNRFKVIEVGKKNYVRLTVPPKVWFGFKGISKGESIILNISNLVHRPNENLIEPKNKISFKW